MKKHILCIGDSNCITAIVKVLPVGNALLLRQQSHKLGSGDKFCTFVSEALASGHDLPALLYEPVGNVRHPKRIIQSRGNDFVVRLLLVNARSCF